MNNCRGRPHTSRGSSTLLNRKRKQAYRHEQTEHAKQHSRRAFPELPDTQCPCPNKRQMGLARTVHAQQKQRHTGEVQATRARHSRHIAKMLTSVLRTLESDSLVSRKAYAEIPPRVEYCLTPLAQTLLPIITELIDWAKNNMPGIMETRMQHIIK